MSSKKRAKRTRKLVKSKVAFLRGKMNWGCSSLYAHHNSKHWANMLEGHSTQADDLNCFVNMDDVNGLIGAIGGCDGDIWQSKAVDSIFKEIYFSCHVWLEVDGQVYGIEGLPDGDYKNYGAEYFVRKSFEPALEANATFVAYWLYNLNLDHVRSRTKKGGFDKYIDKIMTEEGHCFLRAFYLMNLHPDKYKLCVGSIGYVFEDKTMFWEFGGKNMIPMCIEK